jgi:carbon monoxide dehydrogenase subunit G
MQMQGTRLLLATQQEAWQALNDPVILKACIPGCEKFESTEPNVYSATVSLKIGPVAAKFTGKVSLLDIQPPHSYALKFDATGGVAGFGKGESKVQLTPVDQGVELSYSVNSQVGGKIAQLGQRLIDGVAKSLAEDFFARFEKELQSRLEPPSTQEPPAQQAQTEQTSSNLSSATVLKVVFVCAAAAAVYWASSWINTH